MARGKRNDQIQTDPDIGVNMEGETFQNTIEPTERDQDCHAPGFGTRLVRGLGELIRFKLLIILKKSFIKKLLSV